MPLFCLSLQACNQWPSGQSTKLGQVLFPVEQGTSSVFNLFVFCLGCNSLRWELFAKVENTKTACRIEFHFTNPNEKGNSIWTILFSHIDQYRLTLLQQFYGSLCSKSLYCTVPTILCNYPIYSILDLGMPAFTCTSHVLRT